MLPGDYEHDPRAEVLPGAGGLEEHRRRLVLRDYWRSMGTWSPASWSLGFVVEQAGSVLGVQSLEADDFAVLATVDSGSWLAQHARGRGLATSMRTAVLALAFDHLGARVAISSARSDNAASLAVSRRFGYVDNGISLNASGLGASVHTRECSGCSRSSGRRAPRTLAVQGTEGLPCDA